jgi:molecular chaperone HtpG
VLLLSDPVDAFWSMMPSDFEGKPLKSLSKGEVDFALVPLLDEKKTRRRRRKAARPMRGRSSRR